MKISVNKKIKQIEYSIKFHNNPIILHEYNNNLRETFEIYQINTDSFFLFSKLSEESENSHLYFFPFELSNKSKIILTIRFNILKLNEITKYLNLYFKFFPFFIDISKISNFFNYYPYPDNRVYSIDSFKMPYLKKLKRSQILDFSEGERYFQEIRSLLSKLSFRQFMEKDESINIRPFYFEFYPYEVSCLFLDTVIFSLKSEEIYSNNIKYSPEIHFFINLLFQLNLEKLLLVEIQKIVINQKIMI